MRRAEESAKKADGKASALQRDLNAVRYYICIFARIYLLLDFIFMYCLSFAICFTVVTYICVFLFVC